MELTLIQKSIACGKPEIRASLGRPSIAVLLLPVHACEDAQNGHLQPYQRLDKANQ